MKQISEERIDYHNLITQTSGDIAAHFLQNLEKIGVYPPRLSLKILRSKDIQKHLKTKVVVKGVNPQVKFQIFAQYPGYRNCHNCYSYR